MSFDFKLENGDLEFDGSGDILKVFNDNKLRQDVVKIIITPLGSMPLFPWYGSPVTERAIGRTLDARILNTELTNSLQFAIRNLQALQGEQEKSGQFVTPAEIISQILDISIQLSAYDARQYNVSVAVASRRSNIVEESFTLST